jgi:peptidoglycan/xylan/chitin deacetylase (PgdA/CDA1 family)
MMRIPILMYHRIGTAHNEWERKFCVEPAMFRAHMLRLAREGWRAISLSEFCGWLREDRPLAGKPFLLTFDDGFLGVFTHASETLEQLRWAATVFLVSDLIGKTDEWGRTRNPRGVSYPLLDVSHIRELMHRRIDFQSHTCTHAELPALDDATLRRELLGSRQALEDLLARPVVCLAYPFGRVDQRVVDFTREAGYEFAFSVQPGFNRSDVDRYRLRRLDVFGSDTPTALSRKIRLGSNDGSLASSLRYQASRLKARLRLG